MEKLGYDFEKALAIMDSERTPDEEETKEFTTVDLENLILNLKEKRGCVKMSINEARIIPIRISAEVREKCNN